MNKPHGDGSLSGVHATHLGVERVGAQPEPPLKSQKRVTTRLRLERVQLQPFVPSSLYPYVDRAKVRQRARWIFAIVALILAVVVIFALRDRVSSQPATATSPNTASRPTELPTAAAAQPRPQNPVATPAGTDIPSSTPTAEPRRAVSTPPPAPSATATAIARQAADRAKLPPKAAPQLTPPAAASASRPPKVSPHAPAPSSSVTWWY